MDKETIIKGCEYWVNNHKDENFLLTYSSVVELLAVLKEQEAPSRTDLMQRIAKYFCEREDDSKTIEINADDMREIVYWNHRAWKCAQLEKAGKMLE